jgi:hypothetical protein
MERNDDLHDWWYLIEAIDAALNVDPEAFDALYRRLRAVEGLVGAPTLRWHNATVDGHLLVRQENDLVGALDHYRESLRWAIEAGELLAEVQSRRAIAMAAVGLGTDDATELCLDALRAVHAVRLWQKTWQVLDDVVLTLAYSGDTEGAALVLGHLDAHAIPYGIEAELGYRTRAAALVSDAASPDDLARWRRRGEQLTDTELIELAIARLSAVVDPR